MMKAATVKFEGFKLTFLIRRLFAFTMILVCSVELIAQTRTIAGKVLGDDGSPVPNALITIKGSNTRATSKADGSYSFLFTRNTGTMVISSTGFITEEVYIDPNTRNLNISIKRVPGNVANKPIAKADTTRTTPRAQASNSDTIRKITSQPIVKADTQKITKPPTAVTAEVEKKISSQPTSKSDSAKGTSTNPDRTPRVLEPVSSPAIAKRDTQNTLQTVSPASSSRPTTSQPALKRDTQNINKPIARVNVDTPRSEVKTQPPPKPVLQNANPQVPAAKPDTLRTIARQPVLKSNTPVPSTTPIVRSDTIKRSTSRPVSGSGSAGSVSSTPALQSNTAPTNKTLTPQAAVRKDTTTPIPPVTSLVFDTAEITLQTASLLLDTAEVVFEENEIISDQVFVPYGTVRKKALTASIGHITSEQLSNRPLTNVTTVIEGQVAGVMNTNVSGQPGAGLNMRVRGFGTINAAAEPLLIVDGIPYVGSSSNINPLDVESITVLKDAAATALYGSRAGNGVVMITTKKGRRGRNGFSVRVMQGFTDRGIPEYDRVDALQYYPLMWEAYRNSLLYPPSGIGISADSANRVASGLTSRPGIQSLLSYNPFNVPNNAVVGTNGTLNPAAQLLYGNDLDWSKELYRKGTRSDYFVNFNGGGETSDYLFSMGYVKENGYILNSDYKRYNARLHVNVQPMEWMKTGLNISANYSESNLAQDTGSTAQVNPFYFTRNIGPIYPVYAHNMTTGEYLVDPATGQKFYDLGNLGGALGVPNRTLGAFAGRHALAETRLDEESILTTSISARNYQEITFLKNFRFTNNLSADYQIQNYTSYDNPMVGDGAPLGQSRKLNASSFAFVASQLLSYGSTIDVHRFDALIGHESFNQKNTNINGFRQGQTVSGSSELGNFSTLNSSTSFVDRYKIESYFSKLSYEFDDKYFVSASIRRDGNSIFSADSRWGNFWAVGAGWNLSNEALLSNVRWIDLLKLRASYGVTGVSDGTGLPTSFGFYSYQGLYDFSNNADEPGIIQSQTQAFQSTALKWEENKHLNAGLDFALFRNRVNGSVDYFQRTSSDLIFAIPQPLSSGVLTVIRNSASMKNTGVELHLSADIIRGKSFTWNTSVNIATLKNEITEMPGLIPEFVAGNKKYTTGKSVFEYWLPTYFGVDSVDGAALYKAGNTALAANRRIKVNKSGGSDTLTILASNALLEYHGTSVPDFYGSVGQTFTYKGFTLTGLLTFQIGGKTYDANYQGLMSSGTYGSALSSDILQRWKAPGDNSSIPRLDAGRTTDFNAASSRWLIDASYVNIRMVSVAYNLPLSLISRWNLGTARLFVTGENLGFFSKRKGMNSQQDFGGVTSNSYSPSTIISAGISINR